MTDTTLVSTASVATERPARYGKQLASHMGRKVPFTWDEEAGAGTVEFADGAVLGTLRALDGALHMTVEGPADSIERFEAVLGRHLVKFGQREDMVCVWERSDGTPGTEWRSADVVEKSEEKSAQPTAEAPRG
ncbi:DUF2218 domain-containing protein [Brevibacterium samyangense]|uniref:DUF2218 domain-containing protein n=1 Tax=Brevibacterium samyangense TaxID=366888 RepID=A0ABP5EZR7_9MICO